MKRKNYSRANRLYALFLCPAAQPTAERYVVSFPEGTHVNYAGAFASAFPNGLPVGIGSGLLFTGKQGDALTFATITDRGPNADSPKEGKTKLKFSLRHISRRC